MNIVKRIRPGTLIPKWYGVSYIEYSTNSTVCYPIPLNIIIGFARNVIWRYLKTFRPSVLDDKFYEMEKLSDRKRQEHYIKVLEINLAREYGRGFDDGRAAAGKITAEIIARENKLRTDSESLGGKTW